MKKESAFNKQVDGDHYLNLPVQPVPLAYGVFGGDSMACKIAKYLSREKDSWEKQIKKAEDAFDMFLEMSGLSPVPKEFTYTQLFMLERFLTGIPEPIRDNVEIILCSLCLLKQDRPVAELRQMVNDVREHFQIILRYRLKEDAEK